MTSQPTASVSQLARLIVSDDSTLTRGDWQAWRSAPTSVASPAPAPTPADVLAELVQRPAWHEQAACRGAGPALWYPKRGESVSEAQAVCASCPVRSECAEAGDAERYGTWGGQSERQRKRRRRGRRSIATVAAG